IEVNPGVHVVRNPDDVAVRQGGEDAVGVVALGAAEVNHCGVRWYHSPRRPTGPVHPIVRAHDNALARFLDEEERVRAMALVYPPVEGVVRQLKEHKRVTGTVRDAGNRHFTAQRGYAVVSFIDVAFGTTTGDTLHAKLRATVDPVVLLGILVA